MKGVYIIATLVLVLGLAAGAARADWPNTVVKWDNNVANVDLYGGASFINPDGYVTGSPVEALSADDFLCTSSRPVMDIHFSGWCDTGNYWIESFRITFWSDVPATANDESHPGDLLYDQMIGMADPADPLKLGWLDKGDGTFVINLPEEQWFWQQGSPDDPLVYWIGIQGVTVEDEFDDLFFWGFVDRYLPTWGDDAAFTSDDFGYLGWWNWGWPGPLEDPDVGPDPFDGPFPIGWVKSADMAFTLSVPEPATIGLLAIGGLGALLRRRRS